MIKIIILDFGKENTIQNLVVTKYCRPLYMGQIPRSKIAEILVEVLQSQQHIESQIPVMHGIGDSNLRNLEDYAVRNPSLSLTWCQNSWGQAIALSNVIWSH